MGRNENHGPYAPLLDMVKYNDLKALEEDFKKHPNTVGYYFEPIQGRSGVLIPDKGYYEGVRKLCDKYNVLMIADEILCGVGRTGKLIATEWDIGTRKSDILLVAKSISAGLYPVS